MRLRNMWILFVELLVASVWADHDEQPLRTGRVYIDGPSGVYTSVQMQLECYYNYSSPEAVMYEMDDDFETDSISLPDGLMSGMPFVPQVCDAGEVLVLSWEIDRNGTFTDSDYYISPHIGDSCENDDTDTFWNDLEPIAVPRTGHYGHLVIPVSAAVPSRSNCQSFCLKFKVEVAGSQETVLRSGLLIDSRRPCVLAYDFELIDGSIEDTLRGFELTPMMDAAGDYYMSLENINNRMFLGDFSVAEHDRSAISEDVSGLPGTPLTVWTFMRPGRQLNRMGERFASRSYCYNTNATTLGLGDLLTASCELADMYQGLGLTSSHNQTLSGQRLLCDTRRVYLTGPKSSVFSTRALCEEPVSLFVVLDPTFDTADPNRCNNVLQFPINVNCDGMDFMERNRVEIFHNPISQDQNVLVMNCEDDDDCSFHEYNSMWTAWAPIRRYEMNAAQYFGYARLKALGSMIVDDIDDRNLASECMAAEMRDAEAAWGERSDSSDVGSCAMALREAVVAAECNCMLDFDVCLRRQLMMHHVSSYCDGIDAVERMMMMNATTDHHYTHTSHMMMEDRECDSSVVDGYEGRRLESARDGHLYRLSMMLHQLRDNVDCDAHEIDDWRYSEHLYCYNSTFTMGPLSRHERDLCASRLLAEELAHEGARRRWLDLRRELQDMEDEYSVYDYHWEESLDEYEARCGRPDPFRPRRAAPVYVRAMPYDYNMKIQVAKWNILARNDTRVCWKTVAIAQCEYCDSYGSGWQDSGTWEDSGSTWETSGSTWDGPTTRTYYPRPSPTPRYP